MLQLYVEAAKFAVTVVIEVSNLNSTQLTVLLLTVDNNVVKLVVLALYQHTIDFIAIINGIAMLILLREYFVRKQFVVCYTPYDYEILAGVNVLQPVPEIV